MKDDKQAQDGRMLLELVESGNHQPVKFEQVRGLMVSCAFKRKMGCFARTCSTIRALYSLFIQRISSISPVEL